LAHYNDYGEPFVKTKISLLMLSLYFLMFVISMGLVVERFRTSLAESLITQNKWLQTYSQAFLDDIKMGRTASVKRKLNYLVSENLFDQIIIQVADDSISSFKESEKVDESSFLWNVFYDENSRVIDLPLTDTSGTVWGQIRGRISKDSFERSFKQDLIKYGFYFVGLLLIYLGLIHLTISKIISPIVTLTKTVTSKIGSQNIELGDEVETLERAFEIYDNEINQAKIELSKKTREEAVAQVAGQVAHDIRSPLAALQLLGDTMTAIPEEQRIMLRQAIVRIKDIANHLIQTNRDFKNHNRNGPVEVRSKEKQETHLVSALINLAVSEKKFQFQHRGDIEIGTNLSTSYGVFVNVQLTEFRRIISNLIDNSVEALNKGGKIFVGLTTVGNSVRIQIIDNGRGIPPDVLAKIGQRGQSFGKAAGTGLGLYHAKSTVEQWNGSLKISSPQGSGATVTLELPKTDAPAWFVPVLTIKDNQCVVVIDDDVSIHHTWDSRLKLVGRKDIKVLHFYSPDEVSKWYCEKMRNKESYVFLCDYEFIGSDLNGIELVERLGIQSNTILVTSRDDSDHILRECDRLKLSMIPKSLANIVPFANQVSAGNDYFDGSEDSLKPLG
jgi:signal transduction histidine kinase